MIDQRSSALLFRTCLTGCVLGAVATLYLLLGLAGYVHNPLPNVAVVLVLAACALFFITEFFSIPIKANRLERSIWVAILVILIIEIALGFLPPTARDELTHHLAIPKLYARAGRIIEVPMAPYAYYPMLLDMLYTPLIYWGYDFIAKHTHALFGFLTGLLIYAYLTRRLSRVYGLLGFFFFISTPAVLRLSHWAYIDLGITFYSTAALLCLLRWSEERETRHWLILAGLSLGFALATKPNGLLAALLLGLLFVLVIGRGPRKPLGRLVSEFALFAGLTVLPFTPWLVKNWHQTGNPFYPLLGSLFPARSGSVIDGASFVGFGVFEKRHLLYGENIWQILGLPLRIFFSGQDDNPQYFDGVLTPVLLLFLPWAFKGKWSEEKRMIALFAFGYLALALFLIDMRVRYILPIVPSLVVLLGYGIFNMYLSIKRPILLYGTLLFFAAWHGTYLLHYMQNNRPYKYLSGSESREAFLDRTMGEYPAMRYVNEEVTSTAKIYLLFLGRRGYYCERDYFHDAGELPAFLIGAIQKAKDPQDIGRVLNSRKLTHLMLREDLLIRFLTDNLTPAQSRIWNDFATTRLRLAFRERGYAVYEIRF
jgi:4-amino-4-deoxy-L-arabinose transferase-like glycosyltransferase